jgi:flagellar L-ring protein precursor FlgH
MDTEGDGAIDRSEEVELTVAAVVTQKLPNGALAILARQEVRVNYELREMLVTGVVRAQDIDAVNSVSHEKIAEMQVPYGGRGTLSDLQQPRW